MIQLIINADDFGLCASVNKAIINCFKAGNLTSTTLMVNMPGTSEAVNLAKENPGLGIGLHFCLTEGKPLSTAKTIIDENGNFLSRERFIKMAATNKINFSDVKMEFDAQLSKAKSFGIPITHIDSHQHVHMLPKVFNSIVKRVNDENLPLRLTNNLTSLKAFFKIPKKALKQLLLNTISNYYKFKLVKPTNDFIVSIHELPEPLILKAQDIKELVERMADGSVVELMVHPYILSKELNEMYPDDLDSRLGFFKKCLMEHEILTSEPNLFLRSKNVKLVNFNTIDKN